MISATTAGRCKILSHLYTLDLSRNRYLQALRILCENMQAITALAARRSFPSGSAALRSFPRWVSTRGPPKCIKPKVGSRTALQSSGTCPAPIQPPDRRRRCLFIAQVRNVKIEHGYYELLHIIISQGLKKRFCLHFVQGL